VLPRLHLSCQVPARTMVSMRKGETQVRLPMRAVYPLILCT
jgi:hypothetical protein